MAEDNAPEGAADPATGNGDANKTFTQEELDRIVGERIGRERAKYADYNDLKTAAQKLEELEAANQSDLEKVTAERDTFKTQAEQAAAENLRLKVAAAKKLPAELIDRLKGGTQEEMEADADKLLEVFNPSARDFDGGPRESASDADMNSMIRQAAGRS